MNGPELLDDRSSVTKIDDLQESPERALDYIFGDRSGMFGRSISMSTFVFERLLSDRGLPVSKAVNIFLHLINGSLVFALMWRLFRFAGFPNYQWLSLFLAASWLLHPLLVSTVLYIVQRMAMLATTFMLLGFLSYVSWRLKLFAGSFSWWRLSLVPVCLILGLFSKENAILMLPVILLMEVLWFQCVGAGGQKIPALRNTAYSLIALGASGVTGILILRFDWFAARFAKRPFTLEERLLTETRILWDYVGQWYWPDLAKMGLYHDDIALSRSLIDPVSTLTSSAAWLGILVLCAVLCFKRWGRYLAFAILVYLVGHSIESTVWSLELYFEHRNYFPSIGMVLLPGVLIAALLAKMPETRLPVIAALAIYVLVLAAMTGSQATIWSSRPLLVLAHVNGHPNSARANIDMALQLAGLGDAEASHEYSRRAFEVSWTEREGDYLLRNVALSCISAARVDHTQVDEIGSHGNYRPFSSVTTLLTFARLVQDNKCRREDAIYVADHLQSLFLGEGTEHTTSANNYANMAVLENALGRYRYALQYADRFLSKSPGNTRGLLMRLHFSALTGEHATAEETIGELKKMEDEGKLTVQEQQTLALYLENEN
jgi:hypothetical protein